MKYLYKLRSDIIYGESDVPFTVYGVDCLSADNIILSVEDIFFDIHKARAFVELCNNIKLNPAYLLDMAQSALEEHHKIS